MTIQGVAQGCRDAASVSHPSATALRPVGLDGLRPAPMRTRTGAAISQSCSTCLRYESSLCASLNAATGEAGTPVLPSVVQRVPARRTICHAKEWSEFVTVVCEGWASSSVALPDGRRQIHSILLPGDLVLSTGPFTPAFGHTVEAVTDVTCRRYKRADLEALALRDAAVFKRLTGMWNESRAQANQLALSLGRRTAHERIACFILVLADSLARRGMASGDRMEFPLRLKQIADATGLTPVHVSKVQTEFKRSGLIDIQDRYLTITNWPELRHIAGPQ